MKKYYFLITLTILISLIRCSEDKYEYRSDLKSVFDSAGYQGCFVMLNTANGKMTYVDYERCKVQFTPASTFKIPHSLIALQTNAVSSIHDTIRYNGIEKPIESWNRDHDLQSAFKNSVVWYYQDIANRIGDTTMKFWLDTLKDYGTMIRAGRVNDFWLDGSLVISAIEQVAFLEKLYKNELPFKKQVMDNVKQFMLYEDKPDYKIYAKTGFSDRAGLGWFVGWLEKDKNAYIFATNISTTDTLNNSFLGNRILLTKEIFNKLRILR